MSTQCEQAVSEQSSHAALCQPVNQLEWGKEAAKHYSIFSHAAFVLDKYMCVCITSPWPFPSLKTQTQGPHLLWEMQKEKKKQFPAFLYKPEWNTVCVHVMAAD